jgi:hypothetical protein
MADISDFINQLNSIVINETTNTEVRLQLPTQSKIMKLLT